MRALLMSALLWFSAVGCGLMAGVYFAFSVFVMTALDRLGAKAAVSAMNAINVEIVRSLFIPLFLLSSLSCAAITVIAAASRAQDGARAQLVAGGFAYVVGMVGVTLLFNVPLNDALAGIDPSSADAASAWASYFRDWIMWNHVRAVSSSIAMICFVWAIAVRGAR